MTVFAFMITLKESRYCFLLMCKLWFRSKMNHQEKYNLELLLKYMFVRYVVSNGKIGLEIASTSQWDTVLLIQAVCIAEKERLPLNSSAFSSWNGAKKWDQYRLSHSLFLSPCFSLTSGATVCCVCGKLDIGIKCRNYFLLLSTKIENHEEPHKRSHDGILEWPQIWIPIKLTDNEFLITESIKI